jgi:hypothetical protein
MHMMHYKIAGFGPLHVCVPCCPWKSLSVLKSQTRLFKVNVCKHGPFYSPFQFAYAASHRHHANMPTTTLAQRSGLRPQGWLHLSIFMALFHVRNAADSILHMFRGCQRTTTGNRLVHKAKAKLCAQPCIVILSLSTAKVFWA